MERITKYIVNGILWGTCGRFDMMQAKNINRPEWGFNSLIPDRGYKKDDVIEECYRDSDCLWVKKNGNIIFLLDKNQEQMEHELYMKSLLQSKGIHHKKYNP